MRLAVGSNQIFRATKISGKFAISEWAIVRKPIVVDTVKKIAALYLLFVVTVIYGYSVGRFNVFPYDHIDPLPSALAAQLPQFAPGDLAISYATSSLLLGLDPKTLNVK